MIDQCNEEWWNNALQHIKTRSDFHLSREMNWIAKEIIAWKGFQILSKVTSSIGDELMSAEDDLMR